MYLKFADLGLWLIIPLPLSTSVLLFIEQGRYSVVKPPRVVLVLAKQLESNSYFKSFENSFFVCLRLSRIMLVLWSMGRVKDLEFVAVFNFYSFRRVRAFYFTSSRYLRIGILSSIWKFMPSQLSIFSLKNPLVSMWRLFFSWPWSKARLCG